MTFPRTLCPLLVLFWLTAPAWAAAPSPFAPTRVAALVARLDDDEYATRAAADRGLRELGKAVLPTLKGEAERAGSPEARGRLEEIVRELTADETVPELVRVLGGRQPDASDCADYELRRFGPVIVPLLRQELEAARGEELRGRLARLIEDLGSPR